MTTNHTPTPYRITHPDPITGDFDLKAEFNGEWLTFLSGTTGKAEDALYLAHAANHHDALRTALKEALDALALLQHVADPVAADAAQGATIIIRDGRRILSESAA